MNTQIPRSVGLTIILVALVIFHYVTSSVNNRLDEETTFSYPIYSKINHKNKSANGECKIHAYEGEATVRVWKNGDEDGRIVVVAKEDLKELPNQKVDNSKVKLIDVDENLRKKIAKASENNPEEIKLTGFATRCGQISLAALEYKKGVFKDHLNN